MTLLNVAEICPASRTLGPGQRFVIWVQGCCFNCRGCVSPDWIPQTQATPIKPPELADAILSVPNTEGLTVSGGEPMLQAKALSELFDCLRQQRDLSIICFTGFTLEQLQAKNEPAINQILTDIDVLIDGQYIPELNDNKGWRGSSNQVVHFLTSRHLLEASLFTQQKRDVEIHMRNDAALMVGIPPHNFSDDFKRAIRMSVL
ncbi:radical SAM protein [Aetokthonos hydrillicola Thurmond2011]|jgi:anaerobic ribonucleoside-triphosphate reductase activating protein|uniref:Radical SAM protein n=1 Tax=Aetokthonos hydrillicola Thurmond2011 TaxID=2712845 RepID=A0AAP5M5B2_9CYAN|nr:4Fe-4S single cluster domain-containing protein [Aetokthonos hydrillicola]MBO3460158.1 radical SAM protein [Aetokthonos hydrillicola CCALA 1050]MBW4590486.1 radical SAM protein [Aetokthonos hydrillicola CCALA 1050]MDR9893015.1 radical SAM protein [Aetokthonos hydrillicola Thurmond2011]